MRMTAALSSTCAPAATAISATMPSFGAVSACSIFMASMMARRWPRCTGPPFSRCPTLPGCDVGRPLAPMHALALLHRHRQHLAVHRRAHDAAGIGIPGPVECDVTQADARLPTAMDDVDRVGIRDGDAGGLLAVDGHAPSSPPLHPVRGERHAFRRSPP